MPKQKTLLSFLLLIATLVTSNARANNRLLQDENYTPSLFVEELKELKSYTSELQVVEDYLQRGEVAAARNRYDAILNTCELSRYDKEEWSTYGLWLDVREDMVVKGNDFSTLTTDNLVVLEDLATSNWNSYAGRYAMEILNALYDGQFEIDPMVSGGAGNTKSTRTNDDEVRSSFHIYPNPTSDYFIIQMSFQIMLGIHQLVITDATGKQVHQESITNEGQQFSIDVRKWASGVYRVTIQNDTKLIETKEIYVVR